MKLPEENVFEPVDRQTTDAGVIGKLIAQLWAFGSGELIQQNTSIWVNVKHQSEENGEKQLSFVGGQIAIEYTLLIQCYFVQGDMYRIYSKSKYALSMLLFHWVNLAWSMEAGVWNTIPSLGFTNKNYIDKHGWY